MARSELETGFARLWEQFGNGMMPVHEVQFHPPRRWKFDFCWPDAANDSAGMTNSVGGLAVEIHDGQWTGGKHTSGRGLQTMCEKLNQARLDGWVVLQYTTSDMKKRPIQVIEEVVEILEERHDPGRYGSCD